MTIIDTIGSFWMHAHTLNSVTVQVQVISPSCRMGRVKYLVSYTLKLDAYNYNHYQIN